MSAFGFLGTFLAVLAALFVYRGLTDGGKHTPPPLDLLKARYAKGEITAEEYERVRKELAER